MALVLHVAASPRGDRSKSIQVARAFLEEYTRRNPKDSIVTAELFATRLPTMDGPALEAKYNILHGQESTDVQREAWAEVEAVIAEFKAADKYVFSVPMWNFGIPYRLKHYFDVLVQPTYTFSFDPERGYSGLVTGRPVVIVYARGGEYASPETASLDLQKPYIETILGFIGLTGVRSITVEPTLAGGPALAKERVEQAITEAKRLALAF
jgi:FMN-dependent NADH-azoreductase